MSLPIPFASFDVCVCFICVKCAFKFIPMLGYREYNTLLSHNRYVLFTQKRLKKIYHYATPYCQVIRPRQGGLSPV